MTALEIIEGVLHNAEADNNAIVILREIVCLESLELKERLIKDKFYCVDETEALELENLKANVEKKLSNENIVKSKVIFLLY